MNELTLSGEVVSAYRNENNHFVCTILVNHNHMVNGYNDRSESAIRCFLADKEKSKHINIKYGDRVIIKGYLRQDHRLSNTGKERKSVNVYIKDIRLTA